MRTVAHAVTYLAMAVLLAAARVVSADVALPANMTNPPTAVEAWNILHLATANVDKLVSEPRLAEVSVQVSLCTPALRASASSTVSEQPGQYMPSMAIQDSQQPSCPGRGRLNARHSAASSSAAQGAGWGMGGALTGESRPMVAECIAQD
jgi:hypothetical protein